MTINYKQFLDIILQEVSDRLSDGEKAEIDTVEQEDGKKIRVLKIKRQSRGTIAPLIYLSPFYRRFEQGESVGELARVLLELYDCFFREGSLPENFFLDFEQIRPFLSYRLIHYQRYRAILKNIPHRRYLDLAVIYTIRLKSGQESQGDILIYHDQCRVWKVSEAQLYEEAKKNMPRLAPAEFQSLDKLIEKLLIPSWDEKSILYVLSNQNHYYGAVVWIYPGLMQAIGKRLGEDYYLIPSSVHEMLIAPQSSKVHAANLNRIVKQVNEAIVDPQEQLSDHVYFYRNEDGCCLSITESEEPDPQ